MILSARMKKNSLNNTATKRTAALTVSAETVEKMHAAITAWRQVQSCCENRNLDRDDEGQGPICEHEDNLSGMEWCDPSSCPLMAW